MPRPPRKVSSSSSRRAVLPAEGSSVLRNGHPAKPSPLRPVSEIGDPESVLTFPSSLLDDPAVFSPGRFGGFRSDAMESIDRLFPRGVLPEDFQPRTLGLETDPKVKQVIVGVVPWHAATRQVWAYHRGGGEDRLHGKVSCLIGGHVNLGDLHAVLKPPSRLADLADVLWAAALRETGEELSGWKGNWKSHHSDCRLILAGVVNDDGFHAAPVDHHHFGFVYRLDVAQIDTPLAMIEQNERSIGWVPVERINDSRDRYRIGEPETWTRHVCRHLAETSPSRSSC